MTERYVLGSFKTDICHGCTYTGRCKLEAAFWGIQVYKDCPLFKKEPDKVVRGRSGRLVLAEDVPDLTHDDYMEARGFVSVPSDKPYGTIYKCKKCGSEVPLRNRVCSTCFSSMRWYP